MTRTAQYHRSDSLPLEVLEVPASASCSWGVVVLDAAHGLNVAGIDYEKRSFDEPEQPGWAGSFPSTWKAPRRYRFRNARISSWVRSGDECAVSFVDREELAK